MGCITSGAVRSSVSIIDLAKEKFAEAEALESENVRRAEEEQREAERVAFVEYKARREHEVSGELERSLGMMLHVAMLVPRSPDALAHMSANWGLVSLGEGEFYQVNDILLYFSPRFIPEHEVVFTSTFHGHWSLVGYQNEAIGLWPLNSPTDPKVTIEKIANHIGIDSDASFFLRLLCEKLHLV